MNSKPQTSTDPVTISRVLNLGAHSIRIVFDDAELARRADLRLYLDADIGQPAAGELVYRRDPSVADLIKSAGGPNQVYIERPEPDPKRLVLNLRVFDEFNVALARDGARLNVRYPDNAPLTYLLDDVLQAGIQPFLEEFGGFILHGACMVKNGVGLALMGRSGSGKSTTSFNLVRAGFHCYADDAIVVTPQDGQLIAWPFSREMSLRPVSFQLLQQQGFSFSGYRQERRKYYFPQPELPAKQGAVLRFACLIEVGGESSTQIDALSAPDFLQRLIGDKCYFSFVNRDRHDYYADVVAKLVPSPVSIKLGRDLTAQAHAFDCLIDPTLSRATPAAVDHSPGRAEKLALVRQAWAAPGAEPLTELVTMLADSDAKIFKNALSFFQNFPLAQIEPRHLRDATAKSPTTNSVAWLRTAEWRAGCAQLVKATCREGYDQFASAWLKSAPILFGFLREQFAPGSEDHVVLQLAWSRYLQDPERLKRARPAVALLQLGGESGPTTLSSDHLQLSDQRRDEWPGTFERLRTTGARLLLVPVFSSTPPALDALADCVRTARAHGVSATLAPSFPLCWLTSAQVAALLELGALRGYQDAAPAADEIPGASWIENGCDGANACELTGLGLCSGGYFRAQPKSIAA